MNPEDDQQLWDLLGKAPSHRLSDFFSRNVLRQVKQEPDLLRGTRRWMNWKILGPVAALATLAVVAATMFFRTAPGVPDSVTATQPQTLAEASISKTPVPQIRAKTPPETKVPVERVDPPKSDRVEVAAVDEQDYDTVANLDDLLVLYETSLWDENTSL
jgi:hypothetical protein